MPHFPLRQTLCILAAILTLTACKSENTDQASNTQNTPDNHPTKTASATSPIADTQTVEKDEERKEAPTVVKTNPLTNDELQTLLCKDKKLCRVKESYDAGLDDKQQPMQVVLLTTNSKLTDLLKKNVYYFHENDDVEPCEPLEYWLVQPAQLKNDGKEYQPALLTKACGGSDPHSVVESDKATITPGQFSFSTGSGNGVIYFSETTIELPSLQILRKTSGDSARTSNESSSSSWDWQKMAGHESGFDAYCENETGNYDSEFGSENYDYQPIIIAQLPNNFRSTGWKTTSLGSCSTTVTSSGADQGKLDTGYVTHGTTGTNQDASFKIIMASPTEIFVEVTDDKIITDAKNILHTDHLELWLRTEPVCPKPNKNLFQFGITLDGKTHAFYGKAPKSPTAEVSRIQNKDGSNTTRFKITIPENYDRISLVYSDSDDGKSQKRLIATSKLKFKDQFSLGGTTRILPTVGTCSVQNSKLEYQAIPQKPTSPVIR